MRPTRDALLSRIPREPLGGPNPAAYRDARPVRAKHPDRRHWFETVGPSAANFGPPRPPTLTHHSTYSKRSYPYTQGQPLHRGNIIPAPGAYSCPTGAVCIVLGGYLIEFESFF